MMKKFISKLLVMFLMVSALATNTTFIDHEYFSFAGISNGSGLESTTDNGVITVIAEDDFGDGMDSSVWEDTSAYGNSTKYPGTIYSNEVTSPNLLKLKGDYSDYNSYEIKVDLKNLRSQYDTNSNGGIALTGDNKIWSFNERMTYVKDKWGNKKTWKRLFEITEAGSINNSNSYGNILNSFELDKKNWPGNYWREAPIRIEIKAEERVDNFTYDVNVKVYKSRNYNNSYQKIGEKNYVFNKNQLDFSSIYLADIVPDNDWWVYFDNFYFKATKNIEFDDLKATWKDDKYKLSWELLENATNYKIYYQTGPSTFVEYTPQATDDVMNGYVYISDTVPASKYPYYVEAVRSIGNVKSNKVYLAGDITNPFTLSGAFVGDDYKATWEALDIDDNPAFTYSLYYGDDQRSVDTLVAGAEGLNKATLNKTFDDIYNSETYYGKYIQVVADVDYDDLGITKFYSDTAQIKSDLKLELTHVDGVYLFNWETNTAVDSYFLYRGDDAASIANPTSATSSNVFDNTYNGERATYSVLDNNSDYVNKHFVLKSINNGVATLSNVIKTNTTEISPVLTWTKNDDGQHVFGTQTIAGVTRMDLYYGNRLDDINTLIDDDGALQLSNIYVSSAAAYNGKYAQLRVLKDDVWHYSNIVRLEEFDQDFATIIKNSDDSTKFDFVIDWSDINWPEEAKLSEKLSYYEVYYLDDANNKVIVQTNLKDSLYQINDIYGEHATYLGKNFYVQAVYSTNDVFDVKRTLNIVSDVFKPRKIDFTSLTGTFSDSRDYTIEWAAPVELNVDSQTLVVDQYNLTYGDSLDVINTAYDLSGVVTSPYEAFENLIITDVTKEGEGKAYYHKYFELESTIDHVRYPSNIIYSEDDLKLTVLRLEDDFILKWNEIENADKVKLYYSEEEDGEFELYEAVTLSGTSSKHTLKDFDGENKEYDQMYFKVQSTFGDYMIDSNVEKLDMTIVAPVIEGEFDGDKNEYDVTWEAIDWDLEHYQFYYEDRDEDTGLVEYVKIENKAPDKDDLYATFNSDYINKYIRLAAVKGNVSILSNRKLVKETTFSGNPSGVFAAKDVDLKLGNRSDIIYKFKVYKDMKLPYFKVVFTGTKYLIFDKTSATIEKVENDTRETVDVKLVSEVDESNGITTLYVHLADENPNFVANSNVEYVLDVNASLNVNEKNAADLYGALRGLDETLKNWTLPYYIEQLTINGKETDLGMNVFCEAHWNIESDTSTGDLREASEEMIDVDVEIKDKNQLPGSF